MARRNGSRTALRRREEHDPLPGGQAPRAVDAARPNPPARLRALRRSLASLSPFDVLLWAFVLAGMALRLWRLDTMEFKGDELLHLVAAAETAREPWSAPFLSSTAGVPLGPFFYQLLAVPMSVTQDPVAVTRFIALINIAAIPALFLLVRRLSTPRVALWTTALVATSPWMVVFSRKIWNPDLVVPFLVITLLFLFSAMRRYAPWKVYAFAFFLALLSQLHVSVWLALFPLLPLGLLLRPWRRPRDLVVGVAVFVGVYLVTLGPNVGEFLAAFAGGTTERPEETLPWLVVRNGGWSLRVGTGMGFHYLLGPRGYEAFAEHAVFPWARAVFAAYAVVVCAAAVHVVQRLTRAAGNSFRLLPDRFLLILVLAAASLHVFYALFGIASFPHYHVILALLPPLAVALLLAWTTERFGRAGTVFARGLLVVFLAANVAYGAAFTAFVGENPDAINGDYGRPYFAERDRFQAELDEALTQIDRDG